MAVAFGTEVHVTPGTGVNTGASPSITTPATNPVVIVNVAIKDFTATVSSLTITGFGGTATEIKNVREGAGGGYVSIWKITAPTANTAGTVQANLSASVPFQMSVSTFSGADQTDPSPTADAVTSVTATNPETLTPTNLTASDATDGCGGSTANNPAAMTPNARYTDATTAINVSTGDATGTTGVTIRLDVGTAWAKVAVRIKAAADVVLTTDAAASVFGGFGSIINAVKVVGY
jgi:hypothetical protein